VGFAYSKGNYVDPAFSSSSAIEYLSSNRPAELENEVQIGHALSPR
jgi:hypothetical protein